MTNAQHTRTDSLLATLALQVLFGLGLLKPVVAVVPVQHCTQGGCR